jgi:hypothetical protein
LSFENNNNLELGGYILGRVFHNRLITLHFARGKKRPICQLSARKEVRNITKDQGLSKLNPKHKILKLKIKHLSLKTIS